MTVDERTRRDLYAAFEESWGPDRAEAMMQLLPPVGWGDVATRRDLEMLRTSLGHELHTGLADVRTELHRELARATRTMVFSLTSSVFVVGGLAFAAATLV